MSAVRRTAGRAVWVVAKKEFMDNVRSRWILGITGVFISLTLVMSYFGAAQGQGRTGFQGLAETVLGSISIATILVPILGLMLGYATIVGEKEQGSLLLLLAMPITRTEVLVGKFLGLGTVMAVSVVSGLGISGLIIAGAVGPAGLGSYALFVGASILFSLAFVAMAILLSTVARRRSTAVGLAVLVWFAVAVIFETLLFGVFIATGGEFDFFGGTVDFPGWFYAVQLAIPTDAYGYLAMTLFGLAQAFGFRIVVPDFVNPWTAALSLVVWTAVPLGLALWRFRRQDL